MGDGPVSCFCHFSIFLKVPCLHFLFTQLVLFPAWIFEEVEDYIVIVTVFLVYQTQKKKFTKEI